MGERLRGGMKHNPSCPTRPYRMATFIVARVSRRMPPQNGNRKRNDAISGRALRKGIERLPAVVNKQDRKLKAWASLVIVVVMIFVAEWKM